MVKNGQFSLPYHLKSKTRWSGGDRQEPVCKSFPQVSSCELEGCLWYVGSILSGIVRYMTGNAFKIFKMSHFLRKESQRYEPSRPRVGGRPLRHRTLPACYTQGWFVFQAIFAPCRDNSESFACFAPRRVLKTLLVLSEFRIRFRRQFKTNKRSAGCLFCSRIEKVVAKVVRRRISPSRFYFHC